MRRWVDYVHEGNQDLLWRERSGVNYGDWLAIGEECPKDVLATAYFAYSAALVARAAQTLGRGDAAARYGRLSDDVKNAFAAAFVDDDGRVAGDTQTGYLLALRFDLVPAALRPLLLAHLLRRLEAAQWHLATGFVGVSHLLPVLSDNGRADIAYRLLNNTTFPSWGYSIQQGATTIWERWDGWTGEGGFQTPAMNSFNHYAFGSVGEWLYGSVAGIRTDPDHPGYSRILVEPMPGGGLTSARATLETPRGEVSSEWRAAGKDIVLEVEIPPNATAAVSIPAASLTSVRESGGVAAEAPGVHDARFETGIAVFEVGSGTYRFESPGALRL
jgi:alpha-L-rhamnosidase